MIFNPIPTKLSKSIMQRFLKIFFLVVLGMSLNRAWAQSEKNPVTIDKIIAKVDNYIILKSELEGMYLQLASQGQKVEKCQILRRLITDKMLLAQAEIDSIEVTPDEVESQVQRRLDYIMQGMNADEKEIEERLGKSVSEMREELVDPIREQLTIQRMQQELTQDLKVTPRQVKKFFNAIPKDSIPYLPTEVEVGQIVKLPEVDKSEKGKIKQKLNEIKLKIEGGEDFEKLARLHSEDLGTATKGGSLGWFGRGQLAPEYEAMSLSLKTGEIGDPVESEFGFHLIQLLERRGNRFKTRHILLRPKPTAENMKEAEHFLDSLRNQILADSIKFGAAAKRFSDDRKTKMYAGMFMNFENMSSKISRDQLDYAIYKTVDTMKVENISKPLEFRTDDGKAAVRIIYFKSKKKGHYASLENDFEKIYEAALTDEKNRILEKWFDKMKTSVFIDIDPDYKKCQILENL